MWNLWFWSSHEYRREEKVLETVMETVSPDTTIIVHVGAANPQDSFDLARHAASVGADAISSVVPFYYSHAYNDDNVVSFFASLINTVNIPVLIYNNPKASGYTLTIPLLKELYKEGIAGVKDSSFDLLFFYSVKFNFDLSKLIYIVGTEAFILPTVPLGAKATIAGLANPFPQIVVNAFDAAKKGEYKDAFKIQEKVVELREIQHFAQSIPAIHAFFDILGIDTGYPRKPFKKVDEETKRKINDALKKVL